MWHHCDIINNHNYNNNNDDNNNNLGPGPGHGHGPTTTNHSNSLHLRCVDPSGGTVQACRLYRCPVSGDLVSSAVASKKSWPVGHMWLSDMASKVIERNCFGTCIYIIYILYICIFSQIWLSYVFFSGLYMKFRGCKCLGREGTRPASLWFKG